MGPFCYVDGGKVKQLDNTGRNIPEAPAVLGLGIIWDSSHRAPNGPRSTTFWAKTASGVETCDRLESKMVHEVWNGRETPTDYPTVCRLCLPVSG